MLKVRKRLKASNTQVSVKETKNTGGLFTIISMLKQENKTHKKTIFWDALFMSQVCIMAPRHM